MVRLNLSNPRLLGVPFVQHFLKSNLNLRNYLSQNTSEIPRWFHTIYGIKFKSIAEIDLHWFNCHRLPHNTSVSAAETYRQTKPHIMNVFTANMARSINHASKWVAFVFCVQSVNLWWQTNCNWIIIEVNVCLCQLHIECASVAMDFRFPVALEQSGKWILLNMSNELVAVL